MPRSRMRITSSCYGIGIGLLASLGLGYFVEPMLFQVSPREPSIYVCVAIALLAIAGLAETLPAWWATRVDPTEALRTD